MPQLSLRKLFLIVGLIGAALGGAREFQEAYRLELDREAVVWFAVILFCVGAIVGVPSGRPVFAGAVLVALVAGFIVFLAIGGLSVLGLALAAFFWLKIYGRASKAKES